MSRPLVYEGQISAATEIPNMPAGEVVFIQTVGADVDIEWWDKATRSWSAAQTIAQPGDEVSCPSYRCRLTPAAATSVRIRYGK